MALLKTKFLHPVISDKTVIRSRLFEALSPRIGKRATFVVAPAGFGKTTVIAQWAASYEGKSCWLSLDKSDSNLHNFWRYLIGSLQQVDARIGQDALGSLGLEEKADVTPAVASLLNDLTGIELPNGLPLQLILDDYHLVDDSNIHRSFAYFVDYLPPTLNLIVSTRIEPDLPLARWRVKTYVDELYTADLTFNLGEIQTFFQNYGKLNLSDDDLANIQTTTQGWIAAMQLLTLSQRAGGTSGNVDVHALIGTGKRLIDDYVLSEILEQQPLDVQRFLLETSCLLRMNHELCDSVRGTQDSRELLDLLERSNLFTVPLDNRQYWYRYHDLFREALLNRLQNTETTVVGNLQRKAVRWYLDHELYHEALSQLIALEDWDWLIQVLEENGNLLIRSGYHLYLIEWLNTIPSTLIDTSPRLLMLRIWCLFYDNKVEVLPPLLQQLQKLLAQEQKQPRLPIQEQTQLQSEMSLIQSYLARSSNKHEDAAHLTHQVLEQINETDIPLKSVSYYGVGLDYFGAGDLSLASDALESAIHFGKMEKRFSTVLSSLGLLMWIHFSRGDLNKALSINQATQVWLDNFHKHQPQPDLVSCWRNTALAEIYREQNNLTAAQAYLNPLLQYFNTTEPGQRIMIHFTQAGLAFSRQEYHAALQHIDLALGIYDQKGEQIMFEPPSLRAFKLRCYLASGHLDEAQLQARHIQQQPSRNPLNQQREKLCLARLHIQQDELQAAEAILAVELDAAREKHYLKNEILCLTLLAQVCDNSQRHPQARQLMGHALELAERTNSLRLILDEGISLRPLILQAGEANISQHFRDLLLAGFPDAPATPVTPLVANPSVQVVDLLEPVSKRELEVLQLIHEGLANKQIAVKLNLAPATVKAHIRNLYGKIGATSRTEALAKARKLGLMD